MASVKLTVVFDCQVDTPEIAHDLGRELEDLLHRSVRQLIPSARNSQHIQSGTINFRLELQGRRITLEPPRREK